MTYKLENRIVENVEVDGIDMKDYPDMVMAYVSKATFKDSGVELDDDQLIELQENNADAFYESLNDEVLSIADRY